MHAFKQVYEVPSSENFPVAQAEQSELLPPVHPSHRGWHGEHVPGREPKVGKY